MFSIVSYKFGSATGIYLLIVDHVNGVILVPLLLALDRFYILY